MTEPTWRDMVSSAQVRLLAANAELGAERDELEMLNERQAATIKRLRDDHARLLVEAADLRAEIARLQAEQQGWQDLFILNSKAVLDENERLRGYVIGHPCDHTPRCRD